MYHIRCGICSQFHCIMYVLIQRMIYSAIVTSDFYRTTLCISAVLAIGRCPSVCLSVVDTGVLYRNG